MTDAPFTETHRETLERWDTYAIRNDWHTLGNAIDAALAEIDRLKKTAEYAVHEIGCPARTQASDCTCGLDEAFAVQRETL